MLEALAIIIGYLLGSIPTAYIAGRLTRGVDVRVGGRNPGALTAFRDLGRIIGLVVLIVDIGKGAGAVLIARSLGIDEIGVYLAGFASVVGHCWPVFLKFKGGKGAATANGVLLTLAPLQYALSFPLFLVVLFFTRNVVLGMSVGFLLFPLLLWIFGQPLGLIIFSILLPVFLGLRYWSAARTSWREAGNLRDFIIERKFTVWQTRKKNPK